MSRHHVALVIASDGTISLNAHVVTGPGAPAARAHDAPAPPPDPPAPPLDPTPPSSQESETGSNDSSEINPSASRRAYIERIFHDALEAGHPAISPRNWYRSPSAPRDGAAQLEVEPMLRLLPPPKEELAIQDAAISVPSQEESIPHQFEAPASQEAPSNHEVLSTQEAPSSQEAPSAISVPSQDDEKAEDALKEEVKEEEEEGWEGSTVQVEPASPRSDPGSPVMDLGTPLPRRSWRVGDRSGLKEPAEESFPLQSEVQEIISSQEVLSTQEAPPSQEAPSAQEAPCKGGYDKYGKWQKRRGVRALPYIDHRTQEEDENEDEDGKKRPPRTEEEENKDHV